MSLIQVLISAVALIFVFLAFEWTHVVSDDGFILSRAGIASAGHKAKEAERRSKNEG